MSHFTLQRPRHPGRLLFLLFLAFLIYLIAGAVLPFSQYATVSEAIRSSVSAEDFRQDSPGSDRVMLLETNESALLERIRLLNQAKERIIISTFDMRSGESTEDILAMLLHKAEEGVSVQMIVDGFSGLIRMEGRPLFYALAAHPNAEIRIYNPINPLLPLFYRGLSHGRPKPRPGGSRLQHPKRNRPYRRELPVPGGILFAVGLGTSRLQTISRQ